MTTHQSQSPVSLLRSATTVGSFTMMSRLTGFLRDVLIAAILGAGPLADAFFVAFKLPNFLRRLFAEGAFNAGFVPMFAGIIEAEGSDAARRFGEQAMAVLTSALLVVVLLAELFMPWVVRLFAPGFEVGGIRYTAAVELARITFPYILFVSLVALFSGVLNSIGRFAAAAFAPVLLNLILIGALLLASLHPQTPAHSLAWGVALAGVVQLVWVAVAAHRAGMRLVLRRPRITPRIKRLFGLIIPGAIGAGVAQINLILDLIFASTLAAGSVSYLYFADRLNQLPLGVIGAAIGTALLPLLSRQLRAGDLAAASASQNRALEAALLLTVPAAIALMIIGEPIVTVLFERGAFGPAETAATAAALTAFAAGLPAYVLIKVLVPGFFARQDTRTPVKIAAVCLIANVLFILVLIGPLAHVGIALATAMSNWINAGLLAWLLGRRGLLAADQRLRHRLPRIVGASLVMGAVLLFAHDLLADLPRLPVLVVLIVLGIVVFAATAQVIGATDLREVRAMLRARQP